MTTRSIAALAIALALAAPSRAPAHPGHEGPHAEPARRYKKLGFPPLRKFAPPQPARYVLSNGIVVYTLEDHELPTIDVAVNIKVGAVYEPREKAGLAQLTGEVMRSGGTEAWPGDELDEELERLAIEVEVSMGEEEGEASLSALTEDFDRGLAVLAGVLREPAFPEDKLKLAKKELLSLIERRDDDADEIVGREFNKLLYGPDAPWSREVDPGTLRNIERKDLVDFHGRWVVPDGIILGVWGDFETKAMLAGLEKAFGDWKRTGVDYPPVAAVDTARVRFVGLVDRDDLNQSSVRIGHFGIVRKPKDPDYAALLVMNNILGGSGLVARLAQRVRNELGLAYSVGSYFSAETSHPGSFGVYLGTKSESTMAAIRAAMAELERIRNEPVSQAELDVARETFLNSLVFAYDETSEIVGRVLFYEREGWPMDHLQWMQEALAAVTVEDVQRVAKAYIHPESLAVLVVGKSADFDEPLSALWPDVKPVVIDTTLVPYRVAGEGGGTPAGGATQGGGSPSAEMLRTGAELAARAVAAFGGKEAIQAVRTVVLVGESSVETPEGPMNLRIKQTMRWPDKVRIEVEAPVGLILQGYDGKKGWLQGPMGVVDLPASQSVELRRQLEQGIWGLMKGLASGEVKLAVIEAGETIVAEAAFKGGSRQRVHFDRENSLIVAVQESGTDDSTMDHYADYREVGGIKFPFAYASSQEGEQVQSLQVESLEVNAEVPEDGFAKPAGPPKSE